jgi:hypothetical protein
MSHGLATQQGGAAQPLAAPLCVRPPWSTSDAAPLWGPWLTTRNSRYAYNSRSQENRREST